MRTWTLFLIACLAVACRSRSHEEPIASKPTEPVVAPPADAARKKAVQVPRGLRCQFGADVKVWGSDGTLTKVVSPLDTAFLGMDRKLYQRALDDIEQVPEDGSGPPVVIPGGPPTKDFGYRIIVRSPTEAVAWKQYGESPNPLELQNGAWVPVANLPRAKGPNDKLVALAFAPDGKLWVARREGLYLRFEGDAFTPVAENLAPIVAAASTTGGLYVLTETAFVRYDQEKSTTLAKLRYVGYTRGIEVFGNVAAVIVPGTGSANSLLMASDDDASASRQNIDDGSSIDLLAVDGAGRAWILANGVVTAHDRDGTKHVYGPGALEMMPSPVSTCVALGGGPETLPPPGAFTGTLTLAISGGANLPFQVCNAPSLVTTPPCKGQRDMKTGSLDANGQATLSVPTGRWVPTIQRAGEWLTPDYSAASINTTPAHCDVAANQSCTIQMTAGT